MKRSHIIRGLIIAGIATVIYSVWYINHQKKVIADLEKETIPGKLEIVKVELSQTQKSLTENADKIKQLQDESAEYSKKIESLDNQAKALEGLQK